MAPTLLRYKAVRRALVFVLLFIVGGLFVAPLLGDLPYSHFIAGFLTAVFGTGSGTLVLNVVARV